MPRSSENWARRTIGVWPITSRMELCSISTSPLSVKRHVRFDVANPMFHAALQDFGVGKASGQQGAGGLLGAGACVADQVVGVVAAQTGELPIQFCQRDMHHAR